MICFIISTYSLDNGLGKTPQMGWNSWNHYGCNVNETVIKQTAQNLVNSGLAAKGYTYVNIDDCWQIARNNKTGQIIADPTTFPSGMPYLSTYVHGLGLKFGLYSDAGNATCQGRPGSLHYESIDANTYASWKVDYLKYDNCNNEGIPPQKRYPIMRDALNKTGYPIFYSMCEWGQDDPWLWAKPVGNSWRTTGDIQDNWSSVMDILKQNEPLFPFGHPGGWNDPDMLEVGNGNMTFNEYQAHFGLWAAMKAPLIIGCDVGNMSEETLEILGNEEVIAVNQDALGIQAKVVDEEETYETQVWAGDLANDTAVVILFNYGNVHARNITATFTQCGYSKTANVRDILEHKNLGTMTGHIKELVPPHAIKMYVLSQATSQEDIINIE